MLPRRTRSTLLSLLLLLLPVVALVMNAASCAASGQGENQTFSDAAIMDGTTRDSGPAVDSSPGNQDGSSCTADTMTDPDNCGSCGNKCPSTNTCSCGMCTPPCMGGLSPCCGQCVDVNTDPNNCGTCGNPCIAPSGGAPGSYAGIPLCMSGACSYTCPFDAGTESGAPIVQCGSEAGTPGCYDVTSSALACGACGKACATGDTCTESMCCPANNAYCNGTCTPINTSMNCGACGKTCGTGATCAAGVCVGYSTSNPTVPFINACTLPGATTVLRNTNGWVTPATPIAFPGGFTFSFYNVAQTTFWLGNEGTLGFGAFPFFVPPDDPPSCQGGLDPTNSGPTAVIFGDQNLNTGASGVCYGLTSPSDAGAVGDAGATQPQFVVTWNATEIFDPGLSYTFSIVLTQGTNTLDFQYQMQAPADAGADGGLDSYAAGSNATVGLQQGGVGGVKQWYSCNNSFIPSSSVYDVRFTP
jgi:hypothetical protein